MPLQVQQRRSKRYQQQKLFIRLKFWDRVGKKQIFWREQTYSLQVVQFKEPLKTPLQQQIMIQNMTQNAIMQVWLIPAKCFCPRSYCVRKNNSTTTCSDSQKRRMRYKLCLPELSKVQPKTFQSSKCFLSCSLFRQEKYRDVIKNSKRCYPENGPSQVYFQLGPCKLLIRHSTLRAFTRSDQFNYRLWRTLSKNWDLVLPASPVFQPKLKVEKSRVKKFWSHVKQKRNLSGYFTVVQVSNVPTKRPSSQTANRMSSRTVDPEIKILEKNFSNVSRDDPPKGLPPNRYFDHKI